MPHDVKDDFCTVVLTISDNDPVSPMVVEKIISMKVIAQKFPGVIVPKIEKPITINEPVLKEMKVN